MPDIIIMCWSLSSNRNSLPRELPMLPPNCKAAPSLPAEPPNRWVINVEVKISGAIRSGILSLEWMAESTRLVPVSCSSWSRRYSHTMSIPPRGRKKISQGWASRSSVTNSIPKKKPVPTSPTRIPERMEKITHFTEAPIRADCGQILCLIYAFIISSVTSLPNRE